MEERERMDEYEVDLYEYLRVLWRWRWLIVAGVVITTLAAIPISYMTRRYESGAVLRLSETWLGEERLGEERMRFLPFLYEGRITSNPSAQASGEDAGFLPFLYEGRITLPNYKVWSAAFTDPRSFQQFLKGHRVLVGEEMRYAEERLKGGASLEDYIEPLYAFGEKEVKGVRAEEQFVAAIKLRWEAPTPLLAQKMVQALGLFAKEAIEQEVLRDYVTRNYREAERRLKELENRLSDLRFSLEQNQEKLKALRDIAKEFPQAERAATRQVVSVEKGGYRYLPPSAQIVATEVTITETRLRIVDTERQIGIMRVRLGLFGDFRRALQGQGPGGLFERLKEVRDDFFKDKDLGKDEVLIVRNSVYADFARFEHLFNDVMKFISGPTLPTTPKPSLKLTAAVAFVLGLFCFVLLAFFLEFLQRKREEALRAEG